MKSKKERKKQSTIKPDAETLHKTDPQEEMKGPVSTPMQELEKLFDVSESKKRTRKKKQ
ncbi:hypothetical protein [Niabella beijingensis]|uniref:hypothetical protein n=1 Tax=Niabella beijingensis TaxID=2872700 RepID=UPI001CBF35BD|nr:hypothetical protein [Niabella beijingensis]MBZ4191286.1 hypothetical protein [Niabella beijingensis]